MCVQWTRVLYVELKNSLNNEGGDAWTWVLNTDFSLELLIAEGSVDVALNARFSSVYGPYPQKSNNYLKCVKHFLNY